MLAVLMADVNSGRREWLRRFLANRIWPDEGLVSIVHRPTHRLSRVHEIVLFESCDTGDALEKTREHEEHHGTEGDADDEKACPIEFSDGFDKGLTPGLFPAEQVHGQEEISNGRESHAGAHAERGFEEKLGKVRALILRDDRFFQERSIDQLRREQDGLNQGFPPAVAERKSEAEEDGHRGFFDGKPEGIEI